MAWISYYFAKHFLTKLRSPAASDVGLQDKLSLDFDGVWALYLLIAICFGVAKISILQEELLKESALL